MSLLSTSKTLLKKIAPFILIFLIYLPVLFIFYKFAIPNTDPSGYSFPVLAGDSSEYVTLARNIINHGSFSLDNQPPYHPNHFRTPGYPLFLVPILLFFKSYYAVSFFQIIIAAITAFLIFKIGQRLVGLAAGYIAAFLYVVNASTLYYTLIVMSDVLFVFLVVLAVYLMFISDSKKEYLRVSAAGFLIGYAVLTRPIAIFLPVLFALYYFFIKRNSTSLKKIAILVLIFVASSAVIPSPWMIRNKIQSGFWALSSVSGNTFFNFNIPMYLTFKYNQNIRESIRQVYAETNGLSEEDTRELKNSGEIKKIIWKYISQDPVGYASFHLSRIIQYFGGNSTKNFYVDAIGILYNRPNPFADKTLLVDDFLKKKDWRLLVTRIKAQGLLPLEYLFWFVISLLSAASVILKKYRNTAAFFILLALYFAVLTGPSVHVRYRLPAEPFMFLSAVLGLYGLKDWRKKVREGKSVER